ncbi:MAG: ISNCY family transposase [Candidatus Dadabacteria bacterium]|nr:ISNCY family transposase [Candidatus Dadabacteria bacterium]
MRPKFKTQMELDFACSDLKVTNEYYAMYRTISQILNDNPDIVKAIHADLMKVFGGRISGEGGRGCEFSSDTALRVLIAKQVEDWDYREAAVRIDDSIFLRQFTGIGNGRMMDYSTICRMFKAISKEAWRRVNDILTKYSMEKGMISGDKLRRDTTVYEANIHYPTDSSLLWDVYRVLGRFIEKVRETAPLLIGGKRLRTKDVKRIFFQISRKASKKAKAENRLKEAYRDLIGHAENILSWAGDVCGLVRRIRADYTWERDVHLLGLVKEYESYIEAGRKVVDQAVRRVLKGEQVPNDEKILSIFEPHVELIMRGKAGKEVEFGHIVNIQQVKEKFITGYDVFERKPVEHSLVEPALSRHEETFGEYPDVYADDKGAYESMDQIRDLEKKIDVVAICKKGRRSEKEEAREHGLLFRLGQKFRAGIEGTISFLKRGLGLGRCFYRSFKTFASSVGVIVFAHNLLVLARM